MEVTQMVELISLDGQWELVNNEKSIHITSNVPGSVFESLIEHAVSTKKVSIKEIRDKIYVKSLYDLLK